MTQEGKDNLHLHFIVLIWGFTAILGLLIKIPSVEIVFFRTLIACLGLFVVIKLWRKNLKIADGKDMIIILVTGVLIGLHWITFFLSARISNASVSLTGVSTCSLWISLIEPIFWGRKIRGFEVLLSLIAFSGIGIIFNVEFDHLTGILLAVLSGLIAAIFTIINSRLTKKYDPHVITFYEMGGACLSIGLFFPAYIYFFVDHLTLDPTTSDWFYLGVLAICCTVYAHSISVKLMRRLSAFSVSITVNLEPVYGIILALLILGESEKMSTGFYAGTLLIVISVVLYQMLNKRFNKKTLSTGILR